MNISEELLGHIMPEVSTQITQIIFLALLFIPSLIVLGGVIYASVVVMPALLKQGQQLIDNNTNLTKVTENTEKSLASITPELVKQTNSIDKVVVEIRSQSLDFRSYQTLVSDGLSNHTTQVEANTIKLEANTAMLQKFETTINALPEQIRLMIDDKLACAGVEQAIRALRSEVIQLMTQQQLAKSTGTHPIVVPTNPTENPATS